MSVLFLLYFVEWGLRETGISEWFPVILPPEHKHRQNNTDFRGSFSPYALLSGGLLYFQVPVCEVPGEIWDQGLEDGKKAPRFLRILQTLSSLTNCEVQDYWEWQLTANCYGLNTHVKPYSSFHYAQ